MATMLDRGILGRKLGMTRIFLENGDAVACTVIEAGPCPVLQRKTSANDGYEAVQIGFVSRREKTATKPHRGHVAKSGSEPVRFQREIRFTREDAAIPEVGSKVTCDVFAAGDKIDVIGTMKGRGFQGVIKRHNFATLKESHGAHFFYRHAGSIGSRKPQHTLRGTRMSGQYGNARITVQNLEILRVEPERNLIFVKGAVPGAPMQLLQVREARKKRIKKSA